MTVDLLVKAQALRPERVGGPVALAVLRWLAWRAEDDGTVAKAMATVGTDLGFHHATARRSVRALEAAGFLVPVGRRSGGRHPTTYRVVLNPRTERGFNPRTERDQGAQKAGVNPRTERDVNNQEEPLEERASSSVQAFALRARELAPTSNGIDDDEPVPLGQAVTDLVAGLRPTTGSRGGVDEHQDEGGE
jgi:hypothetical protein